MTSSSKTNLYCSVDLEFTGFDPSRDQILEIGFAFFKVSKKGLEITEKWSQVFKPSIEVHPKILGLTGITQKELDEAPEFNEFRELLQEKLGDAIIVGHNPVMDVKFLESYGIKLSGKVVDTLELVQFILPTHHSYNLENLVHFFGIKHHKAHRALGDAISTVGVLENLLRTYQQFPKALIDELQSVIKKGKFLWQELLIAELPKKKVQNNDSLLHNSTSKKIKPLKLSKGLITIDTDINDHDARLAFALNKEREKSVLTVTDSGTVMRLWKEGFVHGLFQPEDTFSEKAFKQFLNRVQTDEEIRFCLKIIVWLHTNWQTEVVFDLNISFFGGQFRQFIVGGQPQIKDEKVIALDFSTLHSMQLSKTPAFKNRKLVVSDIQNFEKYMSSGSGTRLSWSGVLYGLRLIYNPETEFGNLKLKDKVVSALTSTDLFFGLTYMLLHQTMPSAQYATLSDLELNHQHVYLRISRAAQNLKTKLNEILNSTESGELLRAVKYLDSYFSTEAGRVKWINIDEKNLSFSNQPIDISDQVSKLLKGFSDVHFTDTITNTELLSYFVDRLGLDTEEPDIPNKTESKLIKINTFEKQLPDAEVYDYMKKKSMPLVLVLPNLLKVKDFYNSHYIEIKQKAALFAQGYSGGGNKMFRNFSINPKSILLVTADFMAKQNYSISAKNIIFIKIPDVEQYHPYTKALVEHWIDKHSDLVKILSQAKMFSVLKRLKLNAKVVVDVFGDTKK